MPAISRADNWPLAAKAEGASWVSISSCTGLGRAFCSKPSLSIHYRRRRSGRGTPGCARGPGLAAGVCVAYRGDATAQQRQAQAAAVARLGGRSAGFALELPQAWLDGNPLWAAAMDRRGA